MDEENKEYLEAANNNDIFNDKKLNVVEEITL